MQPPNSFRLVLLITLSAAVLGALFARSEYHFGGADYAATYLHGALVGACNGAILSSIEIYALSRTPGESFRRLSFLPYLALRFFIYVAVILLVEVAVNRALPNASGEVASITRADMVFSVAVSLGYNLLFGVNDLLGPGVLFAFVAGRYHQPRLEERALLFIDMRASTAIAERLGDARFLDFLNRFLVDVSLAVAEAGGEIHKYVGDQVIATWRLKPGLNRAGCVSACFAALERLVANGPAYDRDFGARADFRAALHCGPVAVGELGYLKKEIALIGDAMNTTARIEQVCRDVGCRVLASAALLERLATLPAGVTRRSLGPLPMRGKERALEVYALEVAESPYPAPSPASANDARLGRQIDPASTM